MAPTTGRLLDAVTSHLLLPRMWRALKPREGRHRHLPDMRTHLTQSVGSDTTGEHMPSHQDAEAMKACRHNRCGKAALDGTPYCADHQKPAREWRPDTRGNAASRGYGGDWQRTRKDVLKRDRFACADCGERAVVVHHQPPLMGPDDPERTNPDRCMSLCRPCHERRHGRAK